MDPVKVEGISTWPTPICKCDVQSFLGFCNFYRRFIKGYADVARPLNYLTGNVDFNWTPECQESFDKLKSLITSDTVLAIPNYQDKFRLETDASAYASGAFYLNTRTTNGDQSLSFQRHSLKPNEIMKFMTENFLQS
jgi:hypothetical protein